MAKEKNKLYDKMNHCLSSQQIVKDSNFSDNTDRLQMHINHLQFPKCDLEENLSPVNTEYKLGEKRCTSGQIANRRSLGVRMQSDLPSSGLGRKNTCAHPSF